MENGTFQNALGSFLKTGRTADPLAEELGETGAVSPALSASTPVAPTVPEVAEGQNVEEVDSSSALMVSLLGSVSSLAEDYFPADIIGGCCPRIIGHEQEIVWNAAAEATDTERVHVVWHASGEKIWYLSVRSADMASYANTWCPFASLLPGMRDAKAPPIIYTHFSDESATMMTLLPDALHIHRGTASVVRAKAERTARELGGAPVEEIVPDRVASLTPVPWFSLSLFEERARRILASLSVFAALVVTGLAVFVWFVAAMSTMSSRTNMEEIKTRSEQKSLSLLKSVQEQRASPMREQLARFADVNDGLLSLNGYLDIYMIERNKPLWRAVVPENVTSDRISELGGKTLDSGAGGGQGVIIGNDPEAMKIGRAQDKR